MQQFNRILYHLTKPHVTSHWSIDILQLIPRALCGYWLTSYFGAEKFGVPWSPTDNNLKLFEVAFWFPNDVAAYGGLFRTFAAPLAWLGAFSEAIGGVAWIIGFQTRISSVLISLTMIVAIFYQQYQAGLWNMLPAIGFLWVGIYGIAFGSGRFGVDYLLTLKSQKDVAKK